MTPTPRVLLVEDSEIICKVITNMLERKGYSIVGRISSGEESIVKAVELEPDLVLMDISLSGLMDGVEAARYIFQLFQIPIVFITALADDTLTERAKQAQPLGYILKPFTDKDVLSNVELALHNHAIRKKFMGAYPIGEPKKIMAALDTLLVMDTRGRIIFCNPYSTRFLEIPEKQILMHYWRELLMIITESTGVEISDPVPEIVKEMHVISHELDTAVVMQSGKNKKARVTLRPIRDDKNELIGIFMHIRENTPDQIQTAAIKRI